ncbi:MAG: 5-bromo-4-chloroindolyl phosphate hydrolysis family protein [Eubacterium sp.]|nr:5-bromo-4-chloroindolyl phosphate hydrolysis family protein [Eubacterium sp.]
MRKLKETLRTIGAAAGAIALFFLLYLGMKFPAWLAAVLAVALYFGMYFLLKPSTKIGSVDVDSMKGGLDSLKVMEEARRDISSMEKKLNLIESTAVRKSVSGLVATGHKILDYLTEHPDKISKTNRFTDYYLDTAEKLVDKYTDLQRTGLPDHGGNGGQLTSETADALELLNTAFDKQLSRLLEGEKMEIETDIEVLKNTMKMEGDQ